jgi:hypothetical protein
MQFADEELRDASINANPGGDGRVLDDGGKVMGDAMLEVSLPVKAARCWLQCLGTPRDLACAARTWAPARRFTSSTSTCRANTKPYSSIYELSRRFHNRTVGSRLRDATLIAKLRVSLGPPRAGFFLFYRRDVAV